MKDGVPLGEDGLKQITSFAQAGSHLEVTKIEPRLDPMWARLRSAPHAYAGPEREAEIVDDDDAGADAGAEGEDADATVGVEEDDLIENTQASKVEIHAALADGPAFRDPNRGGRWRGIDDTYAAHVLEMLVVTAQAKGMALDAVTRRVLNRRWPPTIPRRPSP